MSARQPNNKIANLQAMVRTMGTAGPRLQTVQARRQMVAEFCKMVGRRVGAHRPPPPGTGDLSPRMRQTLQLLLAGDGEKQVAAKLGLSRHTVHVYVKALHKHFGVSSRGELMARCLGAARD